MATAIVSTARNVPVRSDVAMTGEITLSGLVLPVGGIREKVLAARRHGITTVILPHANEVDLAELSADVRKEMTFIPVRTLEEALAISMPDVAEAALSDDTLADEDDNAGADVTGATGATAARPAVD